MTFFGMHPSVQMLWNHHRSGQLSGKVSLGDSAFRPLFPQLLCTESAPWAGELSVAHVMRTASHGQQGGFVYVSSTSGSVA